MEPDPALRGVYRTEHNCAYCDERIYVCDEVILVQIVYPNFVVDHIELYDIDNGCGGFEYEPWFFHLDCWESVMEELDELTEDAPPMLDPLSIFDCSHCKSGIRPWESSCLVTPGEFHRSPRAPNGVQDIHFEACLGEPQLLCTACIAMINDELFEMWEDFSHNGECTQGAYRRCWRGNCCEGVEYPDLEYPGLECPYYKEQVG